MKSFYFSYIVPSSGSGEADAGEFLQHGTGKQKAAKSVGSKQKRGKKKDEEDNSLKSISQTFQTLIASRLTEPCGQSQHRYFCLDVCERMGNLTELQLINFKRTVSTMLTDMEEQNIYDKQNKTS